MGKHKQSKRERKFSAKGGVQARLDKGERLASKGKVKRKRRTDVKHKALMDDAKQKQQRQRDADEEERVQQRDQKRHAEDFLGADNLGDLDVTSFFATLQETLEKDNSDDDSADDSESEEGEEKDAAPKKPANKKAKKSTKEDESGSSSSSDSDDSDEEEKKPSKKGKGKAKPKNSKDDSDVEEDDDDDDIEAAEARMKAEMKKLQRQDPEFHEFLQENEQSLLNFGEDDDEDAPKERDDDESEDGDDDDGKKQSPKDKEQQDDDDDEGEEAAQSIELTPKILKSLEHGAFQAHGIKSFKKIVRAYKSACQVASASDVIVDEGSKASKRKKNQEKSFRIESSQVFDKLMVTCLNRCHEAFYYHLLASDEEREALTGSATSNKNNQKSKKADNNNDKKGKSSKGKRKTKEDDEMDVVEEEETTKQEDETAEDGENLDDKPLDPKTLERSPRWTEVKSILNTFIKSTLHLISESKEPDLLAIVLKSLSKYVRYMTPFPRSAESLLKTLTDLWSAPLGDASADYQVVRLNAFLRIRQLALTQPFPFIELCLKKTYLAYARRAKFGGNASSIMNNALPTLTFMGNCLVELYSLDPQSSYQHAFVYIRQLALFLRTAMQKKTPEAFQQVYCWQYMHCLKLWVAVLSAACKQSTDGSGDGTPYKDDQLMRSLIYPLTEIILGTVRLAPAPSRHVPLRFHCVRLLQQLAAAAEMYSPTTALLLEIFDFKELNKKPKKIKSKGGGDTTRGVQLPFLLKFSRDDPLRTAEEHEAVVSEIFKLLNREVDLYKYSPGFPEFSIQITQRLKKFMKSTKNGRWRAYARGCVDLCKRYTDFAVDARSKLREAPRAVKRLECLREAKDPSMSERYDAAVEKENTEWTSLIAASSAAAAASKRDKDDDGQSSEGSGGDDGADKITEKKKNDKKQKNKKRKRPSDEAPIKLDDTVMEIEDTVKEGVDWSSDEED